MNLLDSIQADGIAAFKADRIAAVKAQAARYKLLAKPEDIDKIAASYTQTLSPSNRLPRYNKYARKSAAVDANIPDNHPMKGFAQNLSTALRTALQSPETVNMSPYEVVNQLGSTMYAGIKDKKGNTIATSSNKYYRESNTWGMSTLKKPFGYDKWHEEAVRREDAENDKESWIASPGKILAFGAIGATVAASIAALPFTGGGSVMLTLPALAEVFGASALATIPGHMVEKAIHKTEGYRANAASDSWVDNLQAGAVATVGYGAFDAAGMSLSKKFVRPAVKSWKIARDLGKVDIAKILQGIEISKGNTQTVLSITKDAIDKVHPEDIAGLGTSTRKALSSADKYFGNIINRKRELANVFLEDMEGGVVGEFDAIAQAAKLTTGAEVDKQAAMASQKALAKRVESGEFAAIGNSSAAQAAYSAIGEAAGGEVTEATLRKAAYKGATAFLDLESDLLQSRALLDPQGPVVGSLNALRDQKVSKAFYKPKKLSTILDLPGKATRALKSVDVGKLNEIAHTAGSDLRFQDMAADTALDLENKVAKYIQRKGIVSPEKSKTLKPALKAIRKWGVPASAVLLFMGDTDDADASIWGNVGELAVNSITKHLAETGVIPQAIKEGEVVFAEKYVQKAVSTVGKVAKDGTPKLSAAQEFSSLFREMVTGSKGKIREALFKGMSPHQLTELTVGNKAGKMISPAVQKLSYYMAELNNITAGRQIFKNITDRVGHTSEYTMLSKEFGVLNEAAAVEMKHNFHRAEIFKIEKELAKITERAGKMKGGADDAMLLDIKNWKSQLKEAVANKDATEAGAKEYIKSWDILAQNKAQTSQSVRVSLALDSIDSQGNYGKYPWLEGMLTEDDKILTGLTRNFLDSYKTRMEKLGLPVIKEAYFPHRPNKLISEMLQDLDPGRYDAQAFNRFYSRTSPNSRPAVPDLVDTMNWYIADTEKRLANHQFWNVEGWKDVMHSKMVQAHPGVADAFDDLYMGSNPIEWTALNKTAAIYSNCEVYKRLFLSTGAGLKHLTKAVGTIAQMPYEHIIPTVVGAGRITYHNVADQVHLTDKLIKMGFMKKEAHETITKMSKALMGTNVSRQMVVDSTMEIPHATFQKFQKVANKVQDVGSFFLNTAEIFDRAMSIEAASRMRAKRGMTAAQALYGIHHQILTNNFISREFNVPFLKHPMARALAMFQATPYKIAERRAVAAVRSKRTIVEIAKGVKISIKEDGGKQLLKDLRAVGKYIKTAEKQYQANMFVDALSNETDFFGTPVLYNSMKEMTVAAAATYGAAVGVNSALEHHFFHLPFLDQRDYRLTLGINPIVQAAMTTWHYRRDNDDSFLITDMYQNWLGTGGALIPMSVVRGMNIMEGHSPDIYGDDELRLLRYFLSVPAYDTYHGK